MRRIILQNTLLLFCVPAIAQYTFNNSGNLQIHPGASVTAFGNFTNTSAASLVNNSNFYIKGTITNDQASMAVGTGTLFLNGNGAQALNGAQNFNAFNLVTDNAAGFTLNNNLGISGVHTFTNGIIATSATPNYLIYQDGSSYSGDNDARHVNGWVKKTGATDFIFPVGNGTYERPAAIENLSAISEINARHRLSTPNTASVQWPIQIINPNEYWEINRVSGGTAQVHLNWVNSKVPFPDFILSDIRAVYDNAGVWTSQGGSATGSVYTTGDITSTAMNSFGLFTIGSIGWTLPLKFLNISAERKQGSTLVKWETTQEHNVDHYVVERGYSNSTFTKTGSVPALNNNTGAGYEYTDVFSLQGIAYYRIRSVDKDGKESFSGIASVSENNNRNEAIALLNNPVHKNIYLSAATSHKGRYTYKLFNTSGQVAQAGQLVIETGIVTLPLSFNVLPGTYTLHLSNQLYQLTEKIVVR